MKFTKKQLQKVILQEIKIALAKSAGGCLGEEAALQVGDEDEPANFGSGGNMGQISEDGWEDEDPYDAPPSHGGKRPETRPEIDQTITDVIRDISDGPDSWRKEDVISLLEHLVHLYRGG